MQFNFLQAMKFDEIAPKLLGEVTWWPVFPPRDAPQAQRTIHALALNRLRATNPTASTSKDMFALATSKAPMALKSAPHLESRLSRDLSARLRRHQLRRVLLQAAVRIGVPDGDTPGRSAVAALSEAQTRQEFTLKPMSPAGNSRLLVG